MTCPSDRRKLSVVGESGGHFRKGEILEELFREEIRQWVAFDRLGGCESEESGAGFIDEEECVVCMDEDRMGRLKRQRSVPFLCGVQGVQCQLSGGNVAHDTDVTAGGAFPGAQREGFRHDPA